MIFIPLAGMIVVCLLPGSGHNLIRWATALFTLPPLLLSVWMVLTFDRNKTA
jgi:NADH:ubiquinone oxidoreductase subunit 4 (subunit M)